ncbi:MAG: maltose/maltodextrin transport system permease protein [Psychromonas sp.]|jgi:maltose/maltodextrin transport system permease protein|uniref:maltose ABC transporter permease MalF n=1 Tax=Psychromonas sp. TaxID=1884585 RepID=UPI0039E40D92
MERSIKSKNAHFSSAAWIKWGLLTLISLVAGYAVVLMYANDEPVFALVTLVLVSSGVVIFGRKDTYSHRYIYPGIAAIFLFIIFPLMYTIGIAFTNYSGANQLTFERVQSQFLEQMYEEPGTAYAFEVYHLDNQRIQLHLSKGDEEFVSEPITLGQTNKKIALTPLTTEKQGKVAQIRYLVDNRDALSELSLYTESGQMLTMGGLRKFSETVPRYKLQDTQGTLLNRLDGTILKPNLEVGNYQAVDENGDFIGKIISPGFVVNTGWTNFARIFLDEGIRGPFLQIFIWTVVFSVGSVGFTLVVGLVLATVVQWEELRGKVVYRMLLILPYAVPAFISILIFKGLFNQSFGEINELLYAIFNVKLMWFTEPFLAKSMILIVNTWLGYPYIMILCMGLLKSIPSDLYEASAIDGAGPLDNFFKITFPLIIKPLAPLLIASFAFNFNNFVLIQLLTNGTPDIIGSSTPAGHTDLLVSYTYRIAFEGGGGQDFGLASAIATLIFLMVGVLAFINLRVSKRQQA